MADGTGIEWTDATWNIVTGCSLASPGCTNCYAMKLAGTRLRHHPSRAGLTIDTKAGPVWTGETRVNWPWIEQPLSWSKPRKIFVAAHGDLFHPSVDWEDIAQIVGIGVAAAHLRGHELQFLTKRPDRIAELLLRGDFWDIANAAASYEIMERVDALNRRRDDARATFDDYGPDRPPVGMIWGASVEDQTRADERGEPMSVLAGAGFPTWVSYEPALGPVDWSGWEFIKWLVCGGESGQRARPMHPDWVRSARDFCKPAGIAFLFKQWGQWVAAPWKLRREDGETDAEFIRRSEAEGATHAISPRGAFNTLSHKPWSVERADSGAPHQGLRSAGKKAAGRLLDGVLHDDYPAAPAPQDRPA